jgi:malate/lactate dehydrogenase
MGVPAILGEGGVNQIVEVPLSAESRAQMQKTAGEVNNDMQAMRDLGLL